MERNIHFKINPSIRPNEDHFKIHNTVTYGDKSPTTGGPNIWNSFPENIKFESSYS